MAERRYSTRSIAHQTLVEMRTAARARGDQAAVRNLDQRIRCFRIASQLYRAVGPAMDNRH